MALCPNIPDPAVGIKEQITPFPPLTQIGAGENELYDFTVAGVGTRMFGTGVIKVKDIPKGAGVTKAYLVYNTYVSNNEPDPTVVLKGTPVVSQLYALCGSTCWFNPGNEATTYLRNRIYISDVETIVKGNGDYPITGLPVDLTMPIGTNGDRVPGCKCSQGAILVIVYNRDESAPTPKGLKNNLPRGVNCYIGAKLLAANTALWGGSQNYNLAFKPVLEVDEITWFRGNAKMIMAAGDSQFTIPGDWIAINQIRLLPPLNAWIKDSSSLSIREYRSQDVYDDTNSAFSGTFNDCVSWFFFGISGDKTSPKSQFQIVRCAATSLDIQAGVPDTEIVVYSNYVHPEQALPGSKCEGIPYNPAATAPNNPSGKFPPPPFYASIKGEIVKVIKVSNKTSDPAKGTFLENDKEYPGHPVIAGDPDPVVWTVQRGEGGTTAKVHAAGECIYLLSPPKFIKDTMAGLTPRGRPPQRPNPGRPRGRFRR